MQWKNALLSTEKSVSSGSQWIEWNHVMRTANKNTSEAGKCDIHISGISTVYRSVCEGNAVQRNFSRVRSQWHHLVPLNPLTPPSRSVFLQSMTASLWWICDVYASSCKMDCFSFSTSGIKIWSGEQHTRCGFLCCIFHYFFFYLK